MSAEGAKSTGLDLMTFGGRRKFRALVRSISSKRLGAAAAVTLAAAHTVSDDDGRCTDEQVIAALRDGDARIPNTEAMRSVAWHSKLRGDAYDVLMLVASFADVETKQITTSAT